MESGLGSTEAYASQDILPAVHHEQPSVILLQTDLPGHLHGLELVCSIRRDLLASSIPIIIFYSQATSVTAELAEKVAACIQEPVSFSAFQEALAKAGIPFQEFNQTPKIDRENSDPALIRIKKHPKKKRKTAQ